MNSNQRHNKQENIIRLHGATAVLVLVSLLMAAGFYFFPWIGDDIHYRMPLREYFVDGGPLDWQAVWADLVHRHNYDNSRLCTWLMYPLELLPQWLLSLLSGVAYYLSLDMGLRLVSLRGSFKAAVLFSTMLTVMLPWVDQMYIFDFQLAYLWALALSSWLLYLYINKKGRLWAVALLGLVIGLWQESYGLPLFCAFVVLGISRRRWGDRRSVVVTVMLLAGLAWLYLSPGGQAYRTSRFQPFFNRANILQPFALPIIVATFWWLWREVRQRMRGVKDTVGALPVVLVVSGIVSAAVMIYALHGPRIAMWSVYAASVLILQLLKGWRWRYKLKTLVVDIAVWAVLLIELAHLSAVAVASYREGRVYRTIIEQFQHSPQSEIYADLSMRARAPWLCLQKPYFGIFNHYGTVTVLAQFWSAGRHDVINVIPETLRGYRSSDARRLPGDAEAKLYGGWIVLDEYGAAGPTTDFYDIDYGRGMTAFWVMLMPFTDADGERRWWLSPNAITVDQILHPDAVAVKVGEVPED